MSNNNRIIFLDNIRWLMVMAVVLLHAAIAYNPMATWWYASIPAKNQFFAVLTFILDMFPLPLLFFTAGFFAVPSLRKHGPGSFMTAKLRRLGIPWILLIFFMIPIIPFFALITRVPEHMSFWTFWLDFTANAFSFSPTIFTGVDMLMANITQFSQFHLWFISLLLVFFAGYALWDMMISPKQENPDSRRLALATMFAISISGLGTAASSQITPMWSWFNLHLLLFQPDRLMLYLSFFGLGIYSFNKRWFRERTVPLSMWFWIPAALLFTAGTIAASTQTMTTFGFDVPFETALRDGLLRALGCTAWLGLFLRLGHIRWNRPTRANTNLARNSYMIYLLHMPFVLGFQVLLAMTELNVFIQFGSVLILSVATSWLASDIANSLKPLYSTTILLVSCGLALLIL